MHPSSRAPGNWSEHRRGPRCHSLEPGGLGVGMSGSGGLEDRYNSFVCSSSPGPSLGTLCSREIINSLSLTGTTFTVCIRGPCRMGVPVSCKNRSRKRSKKQIFTETSVSLSPPKAGNWCCQWCCWSVGLSGRQMLPRGLPILNAWCDFTICMVLRFFHTGTVLNGWYRLLKVHLFSSPTYSHWILHLFLQNLVSHTYPSSWPCSRCLLIYIPIFY